MGVVWDRGPHQYRELETSGVSEYTSKDSRSNSVLPGWYTGTVYRALPRCGDQPQGLRHERAPHGADGRKRMSVLPGVPAPNVVPQMSFTLAVGSVRSGPRYSRRMARRSAE